MKTFFGKLIQTSSKSEILRSIGPLGKVVIFTSLENAEIPHLIGTSI